MGVNALKDGPTVASKEAHPMHRILTASVAICAVAVLSGVITPSPVQALTQKECSAKYQAAKSDGSLAGRTYAQYRKAECGAGATAATTEPAPTPATPPAKRGATPAAASGEAVFPSAVSSKYSNEKAGRARMHTCLDQYNANKANNANGGLKWIQKGGGYYSECNKRLKA
jgi:hypothetical protein